LKRITLYLISTGVAAGLVSMLYFLLVQLHFLPFAISAAAILLLVVYLFILLSKHAAFIKDDEYSQLSVSIILFIFLSSITVKAVAFSDRYGDWDAWVIWNLQAKYLTDPIHWKNMFITTRIGHPDYPLLVPGTIAFFTRLFGAVRIEVVSFAFSFWVAILIPIVLYMQTMRKNIILAVFVLWLFATDVFYITRSVSMYADTTLAFLFMASLIGVRQTENKYLWHLISGACLGCCLWTKNEGVILASVFLAFYLLQFYRQKLLKPFILGFIFPFSVFVFFKLGFAPQNDMVVGINNSNTLLQFFELSRYQTILRSFTDNIQSKFYAVKILVFIYLGFYILKRRLPQKQFLMLLTCILVYFMFYIFTVQDLEWHLATSADRLLHQLMPAMVYALLSIVPDKKTRIIPDQQWVMPE